MLDISRQSIYQQEQRRRKRLSELEKVKNMVQIKRMEMFRLSTRKLYYLLKESFKSNHLRVGRYPLFNYLRSENMLIRPKKNYTKTTNSKHRLQFPKHIFDH